MQYSQVMYIHRDGIYNIYFDEFSFVGIGLMYYIQYFMKGNIYLSDGLFELYVKMRRNTNK